MKARRLASQPPLYMPAPHAQPFDPAWDHMRLGLQALFPWWGFSGDSGGTLFRPTTAAHPRDVYNNNTLSAWTSAKETVPAFAARWGTAAHMVGGTNTGANSGHFYMLANGSVQASWARTQALSILMVCDLDGSTDSNTRTLWSWDVVGDEYGLKYRASTGLMDFVWAGTSHTFTLPAENRDGLISILCTQDNSRTRLAVYIQGQQLMVAGNATPTPSSAYQEDLAIGGNAKSDKQSITMFGDLYMVGIWNRPITLEETHLLQAPLWQDPFGIIRPETRQRIPDPVIPPPGPTLPVASRTSIANCSLTLLGERRINSLNDGSHTANLLNARFDDVRDELLRLHPWKFATRRASLASDTTPPVWGATYAYTIPSDCLRVLDVFTSGHYSWRVQGRKIVTNNAPPLEIRYTSRVEDPLAMDSGFRSVLCAGLAFDVCEAITGSSEKLRDVAQVLFERTAEARTADGQEETPEEVDQSTWHLGRGERPIRRGEKPN